MGLAHNGKKIIGLAHNGKKILGIAHNGNVIWRYLVATKLWTSATDSYLIDNLQLDDKGLLYMIDTQSINRISKNDGNIYATKVDDGGICGDLTFNTAQNYLSYIGKTDYWNKSNYSDLTGVYDGQGTVNPVDVTYSKYQINSYNVTLVTYPNGYVDIIDNSNSNNSYPINHATNTSLGTFYLQALDSFGSNSNFTAGDFLAYSSTGSKAYNASSSTALNLEGAQTNSLNSAIKVSYAPIGYDSNKVNYYLSNRGNYYTLFSATKSNSTVNLIYLTYSTPALTGAIIEALVTDYDAYNNLISNITESEDGSNSATSMIDVPAKFTSYSSEKDSSGNSHIYALNYNANNNWTKINKEKLVDLDAGWNVKKMVKNGNMLYVGENLMGYPTITNDDVITPVSVDTSGNIYYGTPNKVYAVDKNGNALWNVSTSATLETLMVVGNYLFEGLSDGSIFILKTSDGSAIARRSLGSNPVYALSYDSSGYIYAGLSSSSSNNVFKLSNTTDLTPIWWNTSGTGANWISTDSNLNAYIGTNDGQLFKYDTNGNKQWNVSVATSSINGIAVNDNDIYIASNGGIFKYDSNGNKLWSVSSFDNYPNNIAVDDKHAYVVIGDVDSSTNTMTGEIMSINKDTGVINSTLTLLTQPGACICALNNKVYVTSGTKLYVWNQDLTVNGQQSRVEAFRIDKLTYSNLMSAINLSTNDSSGNIYQPNSIAVSASNFAVASNSTSANRTLLRSMCVDGNIYTNQSNTGGTQGVCGVPYNNSGAFVNEAGRLSYRKYSDLGTLVNTYSNSAIKGNDPMVGYISNDLKNSTGINWASDGNLYLQNSNYWNGNYPSGYTDNNGDIAMAPIKGVHLAYLIHPSISDIKVFDTGSLSVTKTLSQFHLSNVSTGTSDVIAVAVDGTICYGTKNKDAQTFFFENPDTATLFTDISFNSGYYLLDIASDNNNNFAVLYYNSSSKQVAIDWYTSKGRYISTNTFATTYNSLPYGKIEIDPQNGNIGLIMGNNYSMWTL